MNLEDWLDKQAEDPRIIASVNEMIEDRKKGVYDIDPMKSYYHNRIIRDRFNLHRNIGWAEVRRMPEAQLLIQKRLELERRQNLKLRKTATQELPILQNKLWQ